MGIRFLCEHCDQRVHVKEFLAGKRARCPKCDKSIRIPMESTLEKGGSAKRSLVSAKKSTTRATSNPVASSKSVSTSSKSKPASSKSASSKTVASKTASGNKNPENEKDLFPPTRSGDSKIKTATIGSEKTSVEVSSTEKKTSSDSAAKARASDKKKNPAETEPSTDSDAATAQSDPFTEAPGAMWYVAPPQGGQYGPADGKTMQLWISEGRVSPEANVWREGWGQWQSASVVMPTPTVPPVENQESASDSTPNRSEKTKADKKKDDVSDSATFDKSRSAENRENKSDTLPSYRYQRVRNKRRTMGILLIAFLAITSLVLIVALVIVLQNNS